jgi:hypothetical protein
MASASTKPGNGQLPPGFVSPFKRVPMQGTIQLAVTFVTSFVTQSQNLGFCFVIPNSCRYMMVRTETSKVNKG